MRFLCKLHPRGRPEVYLTTNKRDANKVLDIQVNLYHREEETRAMIVKAMMGTSRCLRTYPKNNRT